MIDILLLLWGQMWVKVGEYQAGEFIGVEHTCDGANIPPMIRWGGVPPNAQSFVVRMYDPDAPADTFIHWVVYNVRSTQIEGTSGEGQVGYNDFGKRGYGGPCPPPRDEAHRYVVEVYALSRLISIAGEPTWERIRAAMGDRILARGESFVQYKRQRR